MRQFDHQTLNNIHIRRAPKLQTPFNIYTVTTFEALGDPIQLCRFEKFKLDRQ